MNKFIITATSAILVLGLSACAGSGNPSASAGERLFQRGGQITQFGDSWTSASKAVRDGVRLDRKSAKSIAHAQKNSTKPQRTSARRRPVSPRPKPIARAPRR